MDLHTALRTAESAGRLDPAAARVAEVVAGAVGEGRAAGLLRGSWLGHPVHPLLVTVPIGAWTASLALRALGQPEAARSLIGLGLAGAVPTVVTGWAEFPTLGTEARRVALIHAAANAAAATLFLKAYRARGGRAATTWSLLGLAAMGVGGALGGHLSYALGAGVYRYQEGARR
ncbi:DUF2231 domain-containing protein [Nocardia sp. NPDC057353]|uniref:DUF2231 domain-containing protein n=1 Tax=Nocardia sp. NPDC057353 TaxID=3346104 RepID=UPI00363420B0